MFCDVSEGCQSIEIFPWDRPFVIWASYEGSSNELDASIFRSFVLEPFTRVLTDAGVVKPSVRIKVGTTVFVQSVCIPR